METHEHEGCKTPMFKKYMKLTVWNKEAENGKGHGGIMVLGKKKVDRCIQLKKEDSNKKLIWFKITKNGNVIRIAACYFAP